MKRLVVLAVAGMLGVAIFFLDIPFFQMNSKRAVETFIENEILTSYRENGFVDWQRIVKDFESTADNRSVWVIQDVSSLDGSDVYRFNVDKTGSFLFSLLNLFPVPGGSNGVYTAIVNHTVDAKVAIIQRGGKPKWLKLD